MLVVALTLGACGAPRSTAAREIPAEEVPYALLQDDAAAAESSPSATPALAGPQLFLIDADDRLVARSATPSGTSAEAQARELLADLVDGPSDDQRAEGLTTSIGPGVGLELVDVTGGVASVDVVLEQRDPSADRLPLVVGEIVLTLTSVSGVDSVRLIADGEPLDAPLPGGARTREPVTASDYAALVAPA